jgi:hypothetical protein
MEYLVDDDLVVGERVKDDVLLDQQAAAADIEIVSRSTAFRIVEQ